MIKVRLYIQGGWGGWPTGNGTLKKIEMKKQNVERAEAAGAWIWEKGNGMEGSQCSLSITTTIALRP